MLQIRKNLDAKGEGDPVGKDAVFGGGCSSAGLARGEGELQVGVLEINRSVQVIT